jgi:transposase
MKSKRATDQQQAAARRRAQLILRVQSGQITAKEAAKQLGISRKTYYKWQQRALASMIHAMEEQPGGRPRQTLDPEKEALRKANRALERRARVLEQTMAIRRLLAAPDKKKA